MESVTVKDLCFTYQEPGNPAKVVLDKASLLVHQKEIMCICGQSGMGKSTFLRILAGLQAPTGGQIYFSGIESELHEHHALKVSLEHRVAFVFQNSALISNLNVFDNVALPIRYHQPSRSDSEIRDQVEALLSSMMVQEYGLHFPYALSAGALRRVAIARAMAMEPRILLMDEPTTGLDAKNRRSLLALIDNQRSLRHATILMVTHDLSIVKELDARVSFLHKGKLSDPIRHTEFALAQEEYIRDMLEEMNQEG